MGGTEPRKMTESMESINIETDNSKKASARTHGLWSLTEVYVIYFSHTENTSVW